MNIFWIGGAIMVLGMLLTFFGAAAKIATWTLIIGSVVGVTGMLIDRWQAGERGYTYAIVGSLLFLALLLLRG